MQSKLRQTLHFSFRWQAISSVLVSLGSILLLVILSRYLGPNDFGTFAIANVVVGFGSHLFNMALSQSIFSQSNLTFQQLSTLYWLSIISAFLIYFSVFLLAPAIALYYETPALSILLKIAGLAIIFNSTGFQYLVLLQKNLRYKQLSIVELSSFGIYFITTISLALFGSTNWVLVIGLLVRSGSSTLALIYFGRIFQKFQFYFKPSSIRTLVTFSGFQSGRFAAAYIVQKMDTILIGKLFGNDILGIYDIFKQLLSKVKTVVNQVFGNVLLGLFANIREDNRLLKHTFLQYGKLVFSILSLIFGAIILLAHPIVFWIYGKDFVEYVPLFIRLAIFLLFWSFGIIPSHLLTATGLARKGMVWNLFLIPILLLIYIVGYPAGLLRLIEFLIVFELLSGATYFHFIVRKIIPITRSSYTKLFLHPIFIMSIAMIPAWIFSTYSNLTQIALRQACTLGIYTIIYYSLSYFFDRSSLRELFFLLGKKPN